MPHTPGHLKRTGRVFNKEEGLSPLSQESPSGEQNNSQYKIIGSGEAYSGNMIKIGSDMFTTIGGGLEGTSQKLERINKNTGVMNTNGTTRRENPQDIKSQTTVKYNGEYIYVSDNTNVPVGTLLHTHLDNTIMTSHSPESPMGDNSRTVIRNNVTNQNTTRRADVRVRRTPQNGNRRGGNGGGRRGGMGGY